MEHYSNIGLILVAIILVVEGLHIPSIDDAISRIPTELGELHMNVGVFQANLDVLPPSPKAEKCNGKAAENHKESPADSEIEDKTESGGSDDSLEQKSTDKDAKEHLDDTGSPDEPSTEQSSDKKDNNEHQDAQLKENEEPSDEVDVSYRETDGKFPDDKKEDSKPKDDLKEEAKPEDDLKEDQSLDGKPDESNNHSEENVEQVGQSLNIPEEVHSEDPDVENSEEGHAENSEELGQSLETPAEGHSQDQNNENSEEVVEDTFEERAIFFNNTLADEDPEDDEGNKKSEEVHEENSEQLMQTLEIPENSGEDQGEHLEQQITSTDDPKDDHEDNVEEIQESPEEELVVVRRKKRSPQVVQHTYRQFQNPNAAAARLGLPQGHSNDYLNGVIQGIQMCKNNMQQSADTGIMFRQAEAVGPGLRAGGRAGGRVPQGRAGGRRAQGRAGGRRAQGRRAQGRAVRPQGRAGRLARKQRQMLNG